MKGVVVITVYIGEIGHCLIDRFSVEGGYDVVSLDLTQAPEVLRQSFKASYTGIVPDTPTRDLFLHNESRATGLYAQDQVALDERWNLMMAGRYDDATETRRDFIADTVAEVRDTRFSPRIGIVFTPSAGRSVYAGYTESFSSANFAVAGGESFDPIAARQYEVGFKAESADKALYSTVALYQLTKQNIVVRLSAGPPEQFGQIGEAQSRGLEWDMGGRLTPQWNLTASYAYTDAKVTRDVKVGDRIAIPAGSRAIGSVMEVDRGGKFKDRARLGIRFHTLVLADGTQVPISTETIYREGAAPGNSSAAKVGGGAIATKGRD